MAREIFFITTPIYYVNDVPHIGHAYTTVSCDFLARHHRLRGERVFFLTGTDEHGQKVARAAEENGFPPGQWCDEMVPRWKQVWDLLQITNDDFIRTTQQRHIGPVQKLVRSLYDKQDVYLGHYEGPYCVACESFYLESELTEGRCPIHGVAVESFAEENYFFRLSKYTERLLDLYEERPEFIRPESRRREVLSFVKGGLEDLSISRTSLTWGVPIPWDAKHVMYVWIDALQNYITAVGFGSDPARFESTWPADVHVIGKDILRHHCVIWPALLMAAELPLPQTIFAHGFLTIGGQKMGKTSAVKVSPFELIDHFGVDAYRYYFLREIPFGQDGSFSWESMLARYNSDLGNDLGNLILRAATLVENNFEGRVPEPFEARPEDDALKKAAADAATELDARVLAFQLSEGLAAVMGFIKSANRYMDDTAPWHLAKEPGARPRLCTVLYCVCEALRQAAVMLSPAMPQASASIWEQLGVEGDPARADFARAIKWGGLAPGSRVKKLAPLFPRLEH